MVISAFCIISCIFSCAFCHTHTTVEPVGNGFIRSAERINAFPTIEDDATKSRVPYTQTPAEESPLPVLCSQFAWLKDP